MHVLCKVVLIDELHDLKALDETISGLRNRRDEIRTILDPRSMQTPDTAEHDLAYEEALREDRAPEDPRKGAHQRGQGISSNAEES